MPDFSRARANELPEQGRQHGEGQQKGGVAQNGTAQGYAALRAPCESPGHRGPPDHRAAAPLGPVLGAKLDFCQRDPRGSETATKLSRLVANVHPASPPAPAPLRPASSPPAG